jgi:hypothetical protein
LVKGAPTWLAGEVVDESRNCRIAAPLWLTHDMVSRVPKYWEQHTMNIEGIFEGMVTLRNDYKVKASLDKNGNWLGDRWFNYIDNYDDQQWNTRKRWMRGDDWQDYCLAFQHNDVGWTNDFQNLGIVERRAGDNKERSFEPNTECMVAIGDDYSLWKYKTGINNNGGAVSDTTIDAEWIRGYVQDIPFVVNKDVGSINDFLTSN